MDKKLKRMARRCMSVLLALAMMLSISPFVSAGGNSGHVDAATSAASEYADFAKKCVGKSKSELGISGEWCANFAYYCAKKTGIKSLVGSNSYVGIQARQTVNDKGGKITFVDNTVYKVDKSLFNKNCTYNKNYVPKKGDLMILWTGERYAARSSLGAAFNSKYILSHVGIVTSGKSKNDFWTVEGNTTPNFNVVQKKHRVNVKVAAFITLKDQSGQQSAKQTPQQNSQPAKCTHKNTVVRNTVAATCTSSGYTGDTYCRDCGVKIKSGVSTSALGHNWGSWTVDYPATCTYNGRRVRYCTHDYSHAQYDVIYAKGHSWDEGVITKQPTAVTDGEKTYTCSNCGCKKTSVMKAGPEYAINMRNVYVPEIYTQIYAGKAVKPSVYAIYDGRVLVQGVDYTVSYSNNNHPGYNAYVILTGKGNFSGIVMRRFTIQMKAVQIKGAKKALGRRINVSWGKMDKTYQKAIKGVQIESSTSANFTRNIHSWTTRNTATSFKTTRLKKGTYYVRIRTYMMAGQEIFYSDWSSTKKVKL